MEPSSLSPSKQSKQQRAGPACHVRWQCHPWVSTTICSECDCCGPHCTVGLLVFPRLFRDWLGSPSGLGKSAIAWRQRLVAVVVRREAMRPSSTLPTKTTSLAHTLQQFRSATELGMGDGEAAAPGWCSLTVYSRLGSLCPSSQSSPLSQHGCILRACVRECVACGGVAVCGPPRMAGPWARHSLAPSTFLDLTQ